VICPFLVAELKSFLKGWGPAARWLTCGLVVAAFTWSVAQFHMPDEGYTYFIQFCAKFHDRYLPEVKAVVHHEMPYSDGYDSQWYAQIAVHPHLSDPELAVAVDSLPYRARRILFMWTAWIFGGGNPARVLDAFALQNVVAWYLLALLLLRWFPPSDWGNVLRWTSVLLSFGLIFSVRNALLDGPSLLLTAAGMALIEARRPWMGALVMGISGLGKDTSILSGSAIGPPSPRDRATWGPWVAKMALVAVPLAVWLVCIRFWLGDAHAVGTRNFAAPFAGLANKVQDLVSSFLAGSGRARDVAILDTATILGILAQFFFFAFRVRWRDPWWRVGASYAVLMVFLGDAVWESYPSASVRVLLPMTLAFNILVPRRGWWLGLLLLGNLGVVSSQDLLKPPGRETFVVKGPSGLSFNERTSRSVEVVFGKANWWHPEKSRWEYFRWSLGDSTLAIRNPQAFPILADVRFRLRSVDERAALVSLDGALVWNGILRPGEVRKATIAGIVLKPGDTTLLFQSDRPGSYPGGGDHRRLSYSVRDLEVDLLKRP
jgi:hypothetical protein